MSGIASTHSPGELELRIEEQWRTLRTAVRGLGRTGMEVRTASGWTAREMVAHLAAWDQMLARWLRDGGGAPAATADPDVFNLRAIEGRRLVGPEALLDELDTAHRLLLHELALRADALDAAARALLNAKTHRHYAEHARELGV